MLGRWSPNYWPTIGGPEGWSLAGVQGQSPLWWLQGGSAAPLLREILYFTTQFPRSGVYFLPTLYWKSILSISHKNSKRYLVFCIYITVVIWKCASSPPMIFTITGILISYYFFTENMLICKFLPKLLGKCNLDFVLFCFVFANYEWKWWTEMTIITYTRSFKCIAPVFLDLEQKQKLGSGNHP